MNTTSSIMSHEIVLSSANSLDIEEPVIPKKKEPIECEPVPPRRARGFFRTYSSGSLHHILNEVVIPPHAIDYLKILPPPSFIYMKTVEGKLVKKHVFSNKYGDRYIYNDECQKVFLQDIRGLYRYDTI